MRSSSNSLCCLVSRQCNWPPFSGHKSSKMPNSLHCSRCLSSLFQLLYPQLLTLPTSSLTKFSAQFLLSVQTQTHIHVIMHAFINICYILGHTVHHFWCSKDALPIETRQATKNRCKLVSKPRLLFSRNGADRLDEFGIASFRNFFNTHVLVLIA